MEALETDPVFGLGYPPRVRDGVIQLHAPARVVLDLPGDATRWSAMVELDLPADTSASARSLVSVALWLSDGDAERLVAELDQHATGIRINEPLSGRQIELWLDPAKHGPVLDRVMVRDGRVLLAVPAEPATGLDAELP